jgi:hypothetical protein
VRVFPSSRTFERAAGTTTGRGLDGSDRQSLSKRSGPGTARTVKVGHTVPESTTIARFAALDELTT